MKNRRLSRTKAVLPVKVTGKDIKGHNYQDWAHTLDITPGGARLGTIHRQFDLGDLIVVHYRQRKAEFRVVWTKLLTARGEYQVGLEMACPEKDPWGINADAFSLTGANV